MKKTKMVLCIMEATTATPDTDEKAWKQQPVHLRETSRARRSLVCPWLAVVLYQGKTAWFRGFPPPPALCSSPDCALQFPEDIWCTQPGGTLAYASGSACGPGYIPLQLSGIGRVPLSYKALTCNLERVKTMHSGKTQYGQHAERLLHGYYMA